MKYVVRKILTTILTLFAVTFFVFLSFHVISGDPASSMLGTEATPQKVAALREELGLNDPVLVQYGRWAAGLLHGDMGTSYSYRMPVTGMVANKIPVTITLTLMAFVLMVVISIPLGIYTAKHEGGVVDRVIYIINQIIMAIPPFFSGILITGNDMEGQEHEKRHCEQCQYRCQYFANYIFHGPAFLSSNPISFSKNKSTFIINLPDGSSQYPEYKADRTHIRCTSYLMPRTPVSPEYKHWLRFQTESVHIPYNRWSFRHHRYC